MSERWYPAYIGIGSNLDAPAEQVRNAVERLREIEGTYVALVASLYQSAPMGPAGQPDFVNTVVATMTRLEAHEMLEALKAIERSAGRVKSERWGPRVLDLDLLSWSGETIDSEVLTLPHPGIAERNFVLLPWREITPFVDIPGLGCVGELADKAPNEPRIHRMS
jgi:2-amino-4-hydroxy-6-hydroxymethyldihydropteridine diphosphokinase